MITKDFKCSVYSTDIRPAVNCDHNAISLRISISEEKRGKDYWKINNGLLDDNVYVQNVKELIRKIKVETSNMSKQLQWEVCKSKVKEYSMSYARLKQSRMKQYYVKIEQELRRLYEVHDENLNDTDKEKIENLKREIDKWYTVKCKGAYVRSREKWIEQGEKCTKYFLQLEKQRGKKKELNYIEKDGKRIVKSDDILKEIQQFY